MFKKKDQRRVRRSHIHASIFPTQVTIPTEEGAPSTSNIRNQRIEHIVLEELRSILDSEVSDPLARGIWPVSIHLTPDGSYAKVIYAVHERDRSKETAVARQTREALRRASGFIRARLASSLNLKRTPQLGFVFLGLMDDLPPPEISEGDPS